MKTCTDLVGTECLVGIKRLHEVIDKHPNVQGYALPQMNVYKNGFICNHKGKRVIMLNPIILWKFGRRKSNEGCESIKGRFIVKRPLLVKVQFVGEDERTHTKIYTWKMARIIMHEYDHLQGKLISDVGKKWRAEQYVHYFK